MQSAEGVQPPRVIDHLLRSCSQRIFALCTALYSCYQQWGGHIVGVPSRWYFFHHSHNCWEDWTVENKKKKIEALVSHDAILLVCHSFSIQKLLYNLRAVPCFPLSKLLEYDNFLRSIVSGILNIRFSEEDPAWTQATLPAKNKGLGIRSAVQLVLSACLLTLGWFPISISNTSRDLQPHLIRTNHNSVVSWPWHTTSWRHCSAPSESARLYKRMTAIANKLLEDAQDKRSHALLLAASYPRVWCVAECSLLFFLKAVHGWQHNPGSSRILALVLSEQAAHMPSLWCWSR